MIRRRGIIGGLIGRRLKCIFIFLDFVRISVNRSVAVKRAISLGGLVPAMNKMTMIHSVLQSRQSNP